MRHRLQLNPPKALIFACAALGILASLRAEPPTTHPDDPTMDWILSHATTEPAGQSHDDSRNSGPATLPAVLKSTGPTQDESRPGVLVLSDGAPLTGRLSTTLRQPLRVWDTGKQEYEDLPFSLIKSIEVRVISESQAPEWKFAQGGIDIKEYSGRTYPARQSEYAVTLDDGTIVTGAVAAPIYLDNADGHKVFILHKKDKGEPGQKLADLVYVKAIRFTDQK